MIRALFILLFMASFTLLLSGCGEDQTGAADVKWDRDVCERCQMMLSDRDFSAQIRTFPEGKRSRVYKFDDLGCAVLWLDTKEFKNDPKIQIWVNDYKSKNWIDAKKAWYVKDLTTPMNYGLGAQLDNTDGALNYEQAVIQIYEVEEKLNIHGGNFEHE
ncbi:MAG: nitrous oxide reductase accessory protein NosL [gamma proteobacterium symbiont of Lucinoma myriamae]|nr:nitrous oxide reductase accessory protein NosL [gamma proteobacterium symbiont of Lucinoma myriamae]MCU7819350.1 nitrous oxide reductase accessory protein NosL [gamma proteobacterium symbiont of Lucinoma myriamae]MCU7832583.1 nitrous oxide reductase accessory protein NosL [gamma proteobacterium symbiont of Lucinoma myriamae]